MHLGKQLLPWVIALFLVAVVVWACARLESGGGSGLTDTPVRILVVVLALAVSAGTLRQVYLVGESGSRAIWTGNFSDNPIR